MGLADGLEIPPTFGISTSRIKILRAGGLEDMARPKGAAEDDADAARLDARVIGPKDCVICVAASGNTVYPVTIMSVARELGAVTIGMSNNDDTKLLAGSDIPVSCRRRQKSLRAQPGLGPARPRKSRLT